MWIFPGKRCIHFIRFSKGFMTERKFWAYHLWYLSSDSLSAFCSPRTIRDLDLWLLLHWARRTVSIGTFLIVQQMWPFIVLSEAVLIGTDSPWEESIWEKSDVVSSWRNLSKAALPHHFHNNIWLPNFNRGCLSLNRFGDCSEGEGASQSAAVPFSTSFLCVRKDALFVDWCLKAL